MDDLIDSLAAANREWADQAAKLSELTGVTFWFSPVSGVYISASELGTLINLIEGYEETIEVLADLADDMVEAVTAREKMIPTPGAAQRLADAVERYRSVRHAADAEGSAK